MIRFVFLFIRRGKVSVYAIAFLFPFFSCCSPCGFLMNALKFNIESQISSTEKCIHMKQKNATEQQAIRIEWDNKNMAYIQIYVARLLFTLEHSEQRQRTHEWEVNKNQEPRKKKWCSKCMFKHKHGRRSFGRNSINVVFHLVSEMRSLVHSHSCNSERFVHYQLSVIFFPYQMFSATRFFTVSLFFMRHTVICWYQQIININKISLLVAGLPFCPNLATETQSKRISDVKFAICHCK